MKEASLSIFNRDIIVFRASVLGIEPVDMLIQAALRTPGVLTEPAPKVFQIALSDFYPEYLLICQAVPSEPRPRAEVMNVLHANIQDVFNEYGVQIMSPHYLGDPAQEKLVAKEDWNRAPAAK